MANKNSSPTFWNYAAGVGAGTVLTTYAQSVGDNVPLKNWLIFVTPIFTIVSALFLNWLVNEIAQWWDKRKYDQQLEQLEKELEDMLINNQHLTDADRERVRNQLVTLKLTSFEKKVEIVNSLRASIS